MYRRKDDAAKALADFTVAQRQETDLNVLSKQLLDIAKETMHPAHVSLWLRLADCKYARDADTTPTTSRQ